MPSSAQEYADRLIDIIFECLDHCSSAGDARACALNFVSRLRSDPSWRSDDADRVERVVLRIVDRTEPNTFTLRA